MMTKNQEKSILDQVSKENLILLAKHHKMYCSSGDCGVSLIILLILGKKAGLKFTNKEMEVFI